MISEIRQTQLKIEEYFELLQYSIDIDDFGTAEVYLSRLSAFTHMFNQDQEDLYEWAEKFLDEADDVNEYGGPPESSEWSDFD
jgi:hypothetical protein